MKPQAFPLRRAATHSRAHALAAQGVAFAGALPSAQTVALLAASLLLILMSLPGCGSDPAIPLQQANGYHNVSPAEALELIENESDLYIIDVSREYPSGFIPNAIHYSLEEGVFEVVLPRLNHDRPYLIYSHDDESSISAAQMMVDTGVREVYRLDGNFPAWVAAGFPVTRPSG